MAVDEVFKELQTWAEYKGVIDEIRRKNESSNTSKLLFRGQSGEWPLQSTLERKLGNTKWTLETYHRHMYRKVLPAILSMGRLPPSVTLDSDVTFQMDVTKIEEYFGKQLSSFAFARHFGSPSPLLDWSLSPYVAAYFAFSHPSCEEGQRFIHVLQRPEQPAGGTEGSSRLIYLGPYVSTDERHHKQQSVYTACVSSSGQEVQNTATGYNEFIWQYDTYEPFGIHGPEQAKRKTRKAEADDEDQSSSGVDGKHWIIQIPAEERILALRDLRDANINQYTLFGTTEALLEKLWMDLEVDKA